MYTTATVMELTGFKSDYLQRLFRLGDIPMDPEKGDKLQSAKRRVVSLPTLLYAVVLARALRFSLPLEAAKDGARKFAHVGSNADGKPGAERNPAQLFHDGETWLTWVPLVGGGFACACTNEKPGVSVDDLVGRFDRNILGDKALDTNAKGGAVVLPLNEIVLGVADALNLPKAAMRSEPPKPEALSGWEE